MIVKFATRQIKENPRKYCSYSNLVKDKNGKINKNIDLGKVAGRTNGLQSQTGCFFDI